MGIQQRKTDHVDLCVSGDTAYLKSAGFEKYDFRHNALPEVNFDEITTTTEIFGREFGFPLFISSMTGGYAKAGAVNAIIARFCERNKLPFGVGSQRVMLEKPETTESFSVVRDEAPTAFIAANLGGCQLTVPLKDSELRQLTESIKADAFIVHLNPLQELMQPEGDRNFRGILNGIRILAESLEIPVIVKETGAGISKKLAEKLIDAGVKAIDISGAGGTSWSKVENLRSGVNHPQFDNWGIPTAQCLEDFGEDIRSKVVVIASGGIRDSFDIAKALCLGAHFAAAAQPVIKAIANEGEDGLEKWFLGLQHDFRRILCLLGVISPKDLSCDYLIKVNERNF
jgi:isopentenyl-diphosphate delta-isomerase